MKTFFHFSVEQQTSLSSPRDQIPNFIRLETVKTVIMEIYMRIPGCFNSLLDEDDLQLVSALSLTTNEKSQSILDIYSHWTVKVIHRFIEFSLAPDRDQHYTSTKRRLHLVELEHIVQYSTMLTAEQYM